LPEGGYKLFSVSQLFDIHPTTAYKYTNTKLFETIGDTPVITNTSSNNGVSGYVDLPSTENGGIITYSDTTTSDAVFYQPDPFIGYSHIQGLYPLSSGWSEHSMLYFVALFKKAAAHRFDYANKFNRKIASSFEIPLPLDKDGEINYRFMESRIRELEAYLSEAGFENCELSQSEADTLSLFKSGKIEWKHFKMGTLYDKLELKNKTFDKRRDTSTTPDEKFTIPLVNAKHGDNGIMFYGKSDIFDSSEMTIDIVQNGAIATGNVYAQPQRTGVLWDAYLIKARTHNDTENSLLFMACTIQKSIKSIFSYDKKATWNRVRNESIPLPVDLSGEIDYSLIETFVSAIKKKAIQSLKEFIAQEHNAYLSVTG